MKKNNKDIEENKLIAKIDNKYEYRAYIFKYRMKEVLLIVAVLLLSVVILQGMGFDFGKLFDSITSIFGGSK